jgi:hypothetical protein
MAAQQFEKRSAIIPDISPLEYLFCAPLQLHWLAVDIASVELTWMASSKALLAASNSLIPFSSIPMISSNSAANWIRLECQQTVEAWYNKGFDLDDQGKCDRLSRLMTKR